MDLYTVQEQQALDTFLTMDVSDIPDQIPLAGAIAMLTLSAVQSRLPQCGVFDGEGRLTLTREQFPHWRRDVVLLPQYLFMINWADSAPGFSWPETYYATYLPLIDRFIVTASLDSPDLWGVTDIAIGSFAGGCDLLAGAGAVISAWWALQRSKDQERFAYVWSEGRVSGELAKHWADQVWLEEMKEEDE